MRHVVTSREVYHLWANEAPNEHARTSHGSMSYNGSEAYSYAACIGKIVRNKKGKKCYLVSTHTYSTSTTQHQSDLRRSIPSGEVIFYIRDQWIDRGTSPEAMQNYLDRMLSDLPELLAQAGRARTRKAYILGNIQGKITQAHEFAKFFGLKKPKIKLDSDFDTMMTQAVAADAARIKTESAEHKERKRIEAERQAERLESWLSGEPVYGGLNLPYARMRIVGDRIETTQGARVTVESVRRIMPLVLRKLAEGKAWHTNGEKIEIGPYSVCGISSDGVLTVGCHRFEAAEIRRVAGLLGSELMWRL